MVNAIEDRDAAGLPGGVLTFLFSDIEGSTKLFRQLGDDYPALLFRHNEVLRSVWLEHRGVEVRTEGDSFFVVFVEAADAIRAGVAAVEALAEVDWLHGSEIRARIGMHTGVGFARDGDYIAYPVHQAARFASIGHGGQVIVTPETAAAANDLGDVQLHGLGRYRVRDFDEPIQVFQAERLETPTRFAELRAESDRTHNLWAPLPALRGRAADLVGVTEQLRHSRLVSVVGPGGVGKTLLASTIARDLAGNYEHGAWFVDLASHTDASTLRGAIADIFAIAADDLDDHLAERELLLVVDNAEQATAAISELVRDLLHRAPRLHVIVTSREPLAISSERVWRLGLIDEDAAIYLFLERSEAACPAGGSQPAHQDVAELCRRLDGLPLAIELAAARTAVLSVRQIIESLDDQFRLLRSRRRDLDERQRTLFGLIDWSYRLLDEDERAVLRRLGASAGSLDLEGVVAACAGLGLDEIDVADIIWSLSEKSLVLPVVSDGRSRYRLLETVRAFARDAMCSLGELDDVLRLLGERYRSMFDPRMPLSRESASRMVDEIETMRVLTLDLAAADPGLAQWLAWNIGAFHNLRDPVRGLAELSPLIDRLAVDGEAVLGFLGIAANLAAKLGLLERAAELVEKANALRGDLPAGSAGASLVDNVAALVQVFQGDLDAARTIASVSLEEAEGVARLPAAQILGAIESELGRHDAATQSFEEVHRIAVELDALEIQAVAAGALAEIAHRLGNIDQARALTRRSLEITHEAGLRAQAAFSIVGAARLTADDGDVAQAVRLHAAADRMLSETGQRMFGTDHELSVAMKADARNRLGAAAFEEAETRGTALTDLEAFGQAARALGTAPATP